MGGTRKIAAILVADMVGYSRLAGVDEDRTLSRLRGLRSDLIDPAIDAHHGRIVKRTGDGSLIEFRSVVDAVRCAIEVQNGMIERNSALPPERRIEFRVGIHLGDVVEERGRSDGRWPYDLSRITLRPFGPSVTLTALSFLNIACLLRLHPTRLVRGHQETSCWPPSMSYVVPVSPVLLMM
jgi:class 3 adenylate cyclase